MFCRTVVARFFVLAVSSFLVGSLHADTLSLVASDNSDLGVYSPPNNVWGATNGGFGYGAWSGLSNTGGGGTYMETSRQVDGNDSFALYAGSGNYGIARPLSSSLASGEFDITTRFDLSGNGPNLVNLRSGNDTANFGGGELLSFGIVNGNQLSFTDSSGLQTLPSGEARGSVFQWTVNFDAAAGTYTAQVTKVGGGYSGSFSGSLKASSTTVGSFSVLNSSSGGGQNLIFDSPSFGVVVPEPSTLSLLGAGLFGFIALARRKRAN